MKFKLLLLICLLWYGGVADASALLKPTTGATQALRAKSLDVRADISGAFARTTATTTYANPNNRQIEADFIYTAPEGATVTGFAYWFKGEKVVARVVEKERAAEIYQLITVRRRDPALVEMIGKNTFRARISPVEARADLKIEVQYIEPLDATQDGWRWTFPLKEDTKNYPLDTVNFSATLADGANATSNFGEFKGGTLSVQKQNVKDADDIRLDVAASRAPLKVSLFAARDSGADGFFAIALAPDFSATKPTFAISGLKTYDIMRDENARVGQTFVAVGRYRGAGEALVKLGKRSVNVRFPEMTMANNIAAQMWGARRIETLSADDKNRAAVINLSKRFGMPSKWTSWLALPVSEKAAFEQQLLNLEIGRALGRWAQSVAIGDEKRAKILRQRAYDYRARLNKLEGRNRALGLEAFRDALNAELERVIKAGYEQSPDKAKLARLARNLRARGAVSEREIQAKEERKWKYRRTLSSELQTLQKARLDALQKGDTKRATKLLAQSDNVYNSLKKLGKSHDPRTNVTYTRRRELAVAIERERKAGITDSPRQQRLLLELRRISPTGSIQKVLDAVRSQLYQTDLQQAYSALATEVRAGRGNGKEAARLKKSIRALSLLANPEKLELTNSDVERVYLQAAQKLGTRYVEALENGETEEAEALLTRIKDHTSQAKTFSPYKKNFDTESQWKQILSRSWGDLENAAYLTLSGEIAAKRENSPTANDARKQIELAVKNGSNVYGNSGFSYLFKPIIAWKGRAHETAYQLVKARQSGDAETVRLLEQQLKSELEKARQEPQNEKMGAFNQRYRGEIIGVTLDAYIEWEKARIKRGEPLITSQDYVLRPGDPLISVSAPANCQRVVAILPSGELLPLVYDPLKKAWQARFDVPTYANEGAYKVQIIIVGADGARHQMTMTFHVDVTAPDGKGGAIFGADGLNLQLETDEQTDRVSAFTPWGERVELRRDASGIFVARADVPQSWRDKAAVVRFVLTDKAHNRTEIEVDWSQ